jgi:hypothetical protein
VLKGVLELKEPLVHKELEDHKVISVFKEQQELKEHRVPEVLREHKVLKELKEQ